jgi:hypothetical protein
LQLVKKITDRRGYFKELDFETVLVIEIYFDLKQNHYCICCIFNLRAYETKPYTVFGRVGGRGGVEIRWSIWITDLTALYITNSLLFSIFQYITKPVFENKFPSINNSGSIKLSFIFCQQQTVQL